MVAKGLDFPNVTLVGVLSADLSLDLPDNPRLRTDFPAPDAGGARGAPVGGTSLAE